MSFSEIHRAYEEKLQALTAKRHALERKSELRIATMEEFQLIEKESVERTRQRLEQETNESKIRNQRILSDLSRVVDMYSPNYLGGHNNHSKCSVNLKESKRRYLQSVEDLLPQWKQQQSHLMEEKILELQREKVATAARRAKLSRALQQEDEVQIELEQQRRDLVISLAQEQSEYLKGEVRSLLLKKDGQTSDDVVWKQVSKLANDLNGLIQTAATDPTDTSYHKLEELLAPHFQVQECPNRPLLPSVRETSSLKSQHSLEDKENVNSSVQNDHATKNSSRASSPRGQSQDKSMVSFDHRNISPLSPRAQIAIAQKSPKANVLETSVINRINSNNLSNDISAVNLSTSTQQEILDDFNHINNNSISKTAINLANIETSAISEQDSSIKEINELSSFNETKVLIARDIEIDSNQVAPNRNDKEDDNEEDEDDVILLTEDMKAPQVTRIFKQVSKTLEENGDDLVALYLEHKDQESRSLNQQLLLPIVQASLKGESLQQFERNIMSQTILELIREWAAKLLPADVLIGIVTIDRLKKEYKRSSSKGLSDLWEAMTLHLQAIVDISPFDDTFPNNNLDEIVTIFTVALVSHIRNSDKSRLIRKVHNLLKMSILPPDSESASRSPSPPNRMFENTVGANNNRYRFAPAESVSKPPPPPSAAATGAIGAAPSNLAYDSMTKIANSVTANDNISSSMNTSHVSVGGINKAAALNTSSIQPQRKSNLSYGAIGIFASSTKLSALEDDELADEDDDINIYKPPVLKDLNPSDTSGSSSAHEVTIEEDSFEKHGDRRGQSPPDRHTLRNNKWSGAGRYKGGNASSLGDTDEFSF